MAFLYDILIGAYAPVLSGFLGLLGSVSLAVPTLSSADSRRTLVRFQSLQVELEDPTTFNEQALPLLDQALHEIDVERRWFRWGLLLLGLSFVQMAVHAMTTAS